MVRWLAAALWVWSGTAVAGAPQVHVLGGDAGAVVPGMAEAAARGPGELAVGTDGLAVLYDTVDRRVVVLHHGVVVDGFDVRFASDLALTDADTVLVLDDPTRTLALWSTDGRLLDERRLPALVPQGTTLAVDGADVLGVDLFGNGHRIATLTAGGAGLDATKGRVLVQGQGRPVWDAAGQRVVVDQQALDVADAIQASAIRVGDWVVVDAVVDESPLAVQRLAWHLPTDSTTSLPSQDWSYVPDGDVAAAPDGTLWVVVPAAGGPELWEVRP